MTHTDHPMRHYDRTCPECQKPDVTDARETFYQAGWGQNEVMWKCWQQGAAWGRAQALEEAAKLVDELRWATRDGVIHAIRSLK